MDSNDSNTNTITTPNVINLAPGIIVEDTEIVYYTDIELERLWNAAKRGKLTTIDQIRIVNLARYQKHWLERCIGLLRIMLNASIWSDYIEPLLNEYDYGTTDKKVIDAVEHYLSKKR